MRSLLLQRSSHRGLLLLGIVLIAANLRAPITGLPPLLDMIRPSYGLSSLAAGALTTLPLLAFALVSPFSALLAREYGLERTLFAALLIIALGIGLRSVPVLWCLFVGTWVIGVGIAVGNVLLPSLVKRDFPHHVAALTGAYVLAMGVAAALGSAAVVPLAQIGGWSIGLAAFMVLPVVAAMVWSIQLGAHTRPAADIATPPHGGKVWRSALAWQVTLFLGLNSLIYYVAIGWLPTILVDSGLSAEQAGSLHGVLQLATALPGLVIGPLLGRMRDQRMPAVTVALCSALALAGLVWAPHALAWSVLFGIGTGAGIMLGLSFIGLRTASAQQAAALSGMAQCVGYLLAALGPVTMGVLHDAVQGWHLPLILCICLAILAAAIGALAGRDARLR